MNSGRHLVCVCGKKRGSLNNTNWSRHIDACQKRKNTSSKCSIAKFIKPTMSIIPETEGIYINS